ncbi:hypothetical protein [Streptomyces sp. NPDC048442]|uniref:hypothetical protein n=1 Tax=Streptomyces sp. NPDC048442 TaxID=3154823 RepID=UPI003416AA62
MRNLDEFSAALTHAVASVKSSAVTRAQAKALTDAAARGGEAEARRVAASMSTTDLQRAKRYLES